MIVVGLGNPGPEYTGTRHNVGFAVLDLLAEKINLSWKNEFGVAWVKTGSHWLIKPLQFMNTSGSTLWDFQQRKRDVSGFSIETELLVVHDDVDFSLGELHQQANRSAAGHNGVQSIIDTYGQNFHRLRIGIGSNRDANIPAEDYVLQKFSSDELPIISQAIDQAAGRLIEKIQ